jgi:hypothetical protein
MNPANAISYLFGIVLIGCFACGLFVLVWTIISFFESLRHRFLISAAISKSLTTVTPIDAEAKRHILEVRAAQDAERKTRALRKKFVRDLPALDNEISDWDLESLTRAIETPLTDESAEWSLARISDSGKTQFLCLKLSQRGHGLRTAFASLPERKLKMDYASACRWAKVVPNAFVIPANASARIQTKLKEGSKTA